MNEEKGFLDSKTVVAIVLVAVIWLGWQAHLAKKYESSNTTATETTQSATSGNASITAASGSSAGNILAPTVTANVAEEKMIKYEDDIWSFEVSSKGMGLRQILLKKHTDRDGKAILLSGDERETLFSTKLLAAQEAPLIFDVKIEGKTISGTAQSGAIKISKQYIVDSAKYTLQTRIHVEGLETGVKGLAFSIGDKIEKPTSGGFLVPSADQHVAYAAYGNTSTRKNLSNTGTGLVFDPVTNVAVASLGPLYFTKAIVDASDLRPQFEVEYRSESEGTFAAGTLSYLFPAGMTQANLDLKAFAGPKEPILLSSVDPRLDGVIDYWVFGAIAKPMLQLLKWFHSVVNNWGIAIILLTLVVRLLVLPLYMASYKSTKAMQRIQPEMKLIREKYKENPQTMNAEVMRLFKENKVNPFGGCLPMLLQLPIFITLYRVLSQSFELYQAPFAFWIRDLSSKDPYYVLPVLMGVAMFLQQRITPMTTADPAQQKVLMFMPVLFSFMMLSLPSGLTLYIFVSTLFGIAQQLLLVRTQSSGLVTAKA